MARPPRGGRSADRGIASRFMVSVAGVIFWCWPSSPKLGLALAATPDPVVGGVFLPAAGSVVLTGVSALARGPDTPRHTAVAGLALVLGTAIPPLSSSLAARLPGLAVTGVS